MLSMFHDIEWSHAGSIEEETNHRGYIGRPIYFIQNEAIRL
jgi:hypothetical protein